MPNYETQWRCTHCQATGTVSLRADEACDTLFEQVIKSHAEASPACQYVHGDSGLALNPAGRIA